MEGWGLLFAISDSQVLLRKESRSSLSDVQIQLSSVEPSPKYSFQSLKMGMVKSSGIHNFYYSKKLAPIQCPLWCAEDAIASKHFSKCNSINHRGTSNAYSFQKLFSSIYPTICIKLTKDFKCIFFSKAEQHFRVFDLPTC